MGPLPFLYISGRAYTLTDVPREFYPRRSANSTHLPLLPNMQDARGENAENMAHQPAVYLHTFFVCFGSGIDLITGLTFVHDAEAETDNNRL